MVGCETIGWVTLGAFTGKVDLSCSGVKGFLRILKSTFAARDSISLSMFEVIKIKEIPLPEGVAFIF